MDILTVTGRGCDSCICLKDCRGKGPQCNGQDSDDIVNINKDVSRIMCYNDGDCESKKCLFDQAAHVDSHGPRDGGGFDLRYAMVGDHTRWSADDEKRTGLCATKSQT